MKNLLLSFLFVLVVCATGCTTRSSNVPLQQMGGMNLELGAIETDATYDILGPAEGTATFAYLFGFIKIGGENKSGTIGANLPLRGPEGAAIYSAIESIPDADAIIAPRRHAISKNYLIYRELTVSVKGKAIRFNVSD